MKSYWPLLKIFLSFFISYLILVIAYDNYLDYYNHHLKTVDPYTLHVAKTSVAALNMMGHKDFIWMHIKGEPFVRIFYNDVKVTIVNEGCNAIAIMLIFISFMLAFFKRVKQTIIFSIIGLVGIYMLNFVRVVGLNYIHYFYLEQFKFFHDIFFPLIVYGWVIVLWMIWIRRITKSVHVAAETN